MVVEEWQGSGPGCLHIHHEDDEAWHILDGTLTFRFLDETILARPGTTVLIPAGVAHDYFETEGPCRYLMIMTPRIKALVTALHAVGSGCDPDIYRQFASEVVE